MLSRFLSLSCLFVAVLPAQVLTVPATLAAGSSVTIGYSDPAKPGKTIVVEVDDAALPTPQRGKILIHLDQNGNGHATWIVPFWQLVLFNAPNVTEEARFVDPWAPVR